MKKSVFLAASLIISTVANAQQPINNHLTTQCLPCGASYREWCLMNEASAVRSFELNAMGLHDLLNDWTTQVAALNTRYGASETVVMNSYWPDNVSITDYALMHAYMQAGSAWYKRSVRFTAPDGTKITAILSATDKVYAIFITTEQ